MSVSRRILTGADNSVQGRRIRSPAARSRRIAACRWNTSPCGSYMCDRLLGPVFEPGGLKHHQLQAVCAMTWLVMRLPRPGCGHGPRRPNPAAGFLPLDETRTRRIQQKSYTCCSLIPSSARSQLEHRIQPHGRQPKMPSKKQPATILCSKVEKTSQHHGQIASPVPAEVGAQLTDVGDCLRAGNRDTHANCKPRRLHRLASRAILTRGCHLNLAGLGRGRVTCLRSGFI